ncbi:MAG: hypothetical protein M3R13_08970 [Armatimonadota bacterium]|nr:hypothetical protein [Armatimonadota bacterium]
MKKIKDGWVVVSERSDAAQSSQRFAAQPKVYYEDGPSQMLHIHSGETKQEAQDKAQVELDQFMTQNS